MIDLELPPLPQQKVSLQLESDLRTVGGALDGRITLGGPIAASVTPAYVAGDADLRLYVEQEAAHSIYHLVHLSLSFEAELDTPALETTALELSLSSTAAAHEPVAWSMMPTRITDPTQLSTTVRLGPQLKLFGIDATAGSWERGRVERDKDVFLEALHELRADPAWHLYRTQTMPLRGSHRFIMVLRAPRGATTRVNITVRASVSAGRWFRHYQTQLQNPLVLSAAI